MKVFCENCNSEIYKGTFNSVSKIKPEFSDFINQFTNNNSLGYCTKCYTEPFKTAQSNYFNHKSELTEKHKNEIANIEPLISEIPIITLHNPQNWEYDILGIITAQTVTGTGIFAEISSNWTDFFGLESNSYNQKLKDSEGKCKSKLRLEAILKGGNAIIGTDIDYSEAGAGKGMLMVCFSGTAVKLRNFKELRFNLETFEKLNSVIEKMKILTDEIESLKKYQIISTHNVFN